MIFDPQTARRARRTGDDGALPARSMLSEALVRSEAAIAPLVRERAITCTGLDDRTWSGAEVRADPDVLSRILVKLMEDAARSTPPRGRMSIDVRPAGEAIEIRISDNGLGIDPEHLRAITGGEDGRRPRAETPCAMARRMGGELEVVRRPGRGSTARLILPAVR